MNNLSELISHSGFILLAEVDHQPTEIEASGAMVATMLGCVQLMSLSDCPLPIPSSGQKLAMGHGLFELWAPSRKTNMEAGTLARKVIPDIIQAHFVDGTYTVLKWSNIWVAHYERTKMSIIATEISRTSEYVIFKLSRTMPMVG